ncbi:unnamed protein product, partial [marine sediment metagenome]
MNRRQGLLASPRRRGATIVAAAVAMVVVIGFAALAVDVGNLYAAKGELQRAADAAAMAGVSAFVDDAVRRLSYGGSSDVVDGAVIETAIHRATRYGAKNATTGLATGLD